MSDDDTIAVSIEGVLMSTQGPVVMLAVPEPNGTAERKATKGEGASADEPLVKTAPPFENRVLPIFIDQSQALNIQLAIEGQLSPRPMTHDLMSQVMNELGAVVERVVIEELAQSTFYASLYVEIERGEEGKDVRRFDARPSDCIALAVRVGAPIFVRRPLMEQASILRRDVGEMPAIVEPDEDADVDDDDDVDLGVPR